MMKSVELQVVSLWPQQPRTTFRELLGVCVIFSFQSSSMASAWNVQCKKLASENLLSPPRSGHCSFSINQPYVFGGYAEDPNDSSHRYVVNDLWQYNDAAEKWTPVAATGDIPGPRLVSAAATLHGQAYLFGGWDPQSAGTGGIILDDVHVYDPSTNVWKLLDCKLPHGPTSRHVAVSLPNDTILLHTHRCTDHVLLFDGSTFVKQPVSGIVPSPRGLHAACVGGKNNRYLYLFGGAAQDQTMSDQLFCLDLETYEWKELVAADGPCPRAAPTLASMDPCHLVLLGGARATESGGLEPLDDVWIMDLQNLKWQQVSLLTDRPPGRNAATLLDLDATRKLLVGGWAPFRQTWDDCYQLQFTKELD